MKVIDSEAWAWFLFEYESRLYLDVHCNMSFFSYTYMIELNDDELAQYRTIGREYLGKLAHDVHYSVPIAKDTMSAYKGRDVSRQFSDLATQAVAKWRSEGSEQ